jgi:23S rRNA U2552 (ribose-2'-O)-methylase RlmE/FtsJ
MNCCIKYSINNSFEYYDKNLIDTCKNINKNLNQELISWKNRINNDDKWDHFKKFTNKYEMIFASKCTIVYEKPISRAFFKLWEILHDFNIFDFESSYKYKTAHIAEGPGGFIECLAEFFIKYKIPYSEIHGITLKSYEKKIPCWKLPKSYIIRNNIKLFYNNNGDIYKQRNVDEFSEYVGRNSCYFITADGGFDFSSDFNNQEKQSLRLITSEIYSALCLQMKNGHFLLKVFDIFSTDTIKTIALCAVCYRSFYILKPNTSRPANSEKYILFNEFIEPNKEIEQIFSSLVQNIIHEIPIKDNFTTIIKILTKFNTLYTVNQIKHIQKVLSVKELSNTEIDEMQNKNVNMCKEWCKTYNLS